jgi:hypothetical protein
MTPVTGTKLYFVPVHPLHYPPQETFSEVEQPAQRWDSLTRICALYEDAQGLLRLKVCFRPERQPGHIDNVRCYSTVLGLRAAFADPRTALPDLKGAAEQCETQMLKVLAKLHGEPQH